MSQAHVYEDTASNRRRLISSLFWQHISDASVFSFKRNVTCVCVFGHMFRSIAGLVLGEKEEVFAQRAGEFGHFFAAVVGGAGGMTLPLLNTTVDLKKKHEHTSKG